MLEFVKRLLGGSNDQQLKKLDKTIQAIEDRADTYRRMTDEELQGVTEKLRERLRAGETEDQILPDAFAAVREASDRVLGLRHFRVQLIGGLVLHQGRIAEMKTGEGKTLMATLPAYLNALSGKGVHVVTVNEYLARRDSEWMGKVYRFLGLSVGLVLSDMSNEEKQEAYACDITYATNNELGFDYLRDNLALDRNDLVQREHHYAIVDEVDSILIDEARTPLIISGPADEPTDLYYKAETVVSKLQPDVHYTVDEKKNSVALTDEGAQKVEKAFGIANINDPEQQEINHHVNCALRAHALMKKDVDYVVSENGQVIIVDQFTGRLMRGRRFSDGLHQAIEAKEHVKVERENITTATITLQNYFRLYEKLAGMTGTAKTEETEFQAIYGLDVVEIPTNRPLIRKDLDDVIFISRDAKYEAVAEAIQEHHKTGQPVLVGTVNVEVSEMLSRVLRQKGIQHEVLNAKNHAREADIVAQAGQLGAVTIATNMAGRGTDILLGGNPDYLARRELRQSGLSDEVIEQAVGHSEDVSQEVLAAREQYREQYRAFKQKTDEAREKVLKAGGLHIIGTERHESRRVDNQLRGRAGRQGDPGSTQFYIALDDDMIRIHSNETFRSLIDRLAVKENGALPRSPLLTKRIESFQKAVEGRNFERRKDLLGYDNVMSRQREVIYTQRRRVLMGDDVHDNIIGMMDKLVEGAVGRYCTGEDSAEWDVDGLRQYLESLCVPQGFLDAHRYLIDNEDTDALTEALQEAAHAHYAEQEQRITELKQDMRELERMVLLVAVNRRWIDHIDAMEELQDGIRFRAYSGKNPVTEYQIEGAHMFEELNTLIREDTVRDLCMYRADTIMARAKNRLARHRQIFTGGQTHGAARRRQNQARANLRARIKAEAKKANAAQLQKVANSPRPFADVGRNDPCPCGSGKKFKNCCGRTGAVPAAGQDQEQ